MGNRKILSIFIIVVLTIAVFVILNLRYTNSIAGNTSPTPSPYLEVCTEHGGVNCTILNPDASVTCKDGTTDESVPFIYAVPQCKNEIEALTQEQFDFMTKSGCSPPSEMGCISIQSYNAILERLKGQGVENSELGKNELNECGQQIQEYQRLNTGYQACLLENNNPNFNLTGNRLAQPILKSVFCPIFYGYSTYDYGTDTCLCDNGYFLFDGRCVEADLICKSKYNPNSFVQNGTCVVQNMASPPLTPPPQKTITPSPEILVSPRLTPNTFISPTKIPSILLLSPTTSAPDEKIDIPAISRRNPVFLIFDKFVYFLKKIF